MKNIVNGFKRFGKFKTIGMGRDLLDDLKWTVEALVQFLRRADGFNIPPVEPNLVTLLVLRRSDATMFCGSNVLVDGAFDLFLEVGMERAEVFGVLLSHLRGSRFPFDVDARVVTFVSKKR
jgi:hypothetical protein